jgi:hypothetical protein
MGAQRKLRDANARPTRRVKRELLKIDGKSIEVILRTNPRARRFIVKVDPSTGEVSVVAPSFRSFAGSISRARRRIGSRAGSPTFLNRFSSSSVRW